MKKIGTIQFRYFLKDEHIITPDGYGMVVEDEKQILDVRDFMDSEVLIQHRNSSGGNPGNSPKLVDREYVHHVSQEEYHEKDN